MFDPTKLHRIDIEVDPVHWSALDSDTENRVPCKVTWNGDVVVNAGCRRKNPTGGSAQTLAGKPGLSVKFDEYTEGQDIHGLNKIILNNAEQDKSFLNEHLGYEVYRRMGIPAARTTHGVVRLNGVTKGLYVVVEAVNKKFLKRNFGEGNNQGNLYEGPAKVDFVTNPYGIELKDEIEEMRSRDDIVALSSLVQKEPDATFPAAVNTLLDLDGFITGFAIDSIFNHWDGYSILVVNNYYMYNNPATKRFVFMPHGMDQLFQDLKYDVDTWPNGRLAQRVREIAELDKQFHEAIVTVLKTAWNVPELVAMVEQAEATMNTNTNTDPAMMSDMASFNANVSGVKDALALRKAFLLGEP